MSGFGALLYKGDRGCAGKADRENGKINQIRR